MTPKIVRLNATALYALGMDRPTVEALINAIRVTGNDSAGTTVPELSANVDKNDAVIDGIKQDIIVIQLSTGILESAPVPVQLPQIVDDSWMLAPPRYEQVVKEQVAVDDSWQLTPRPESQVFNDRVESLQSEVRQMAEQIAALTKSMQDQMFSDAQIRQIAEKQSQIMSFIDEIKQGTML